MGHAGRWWFLRPAWPKLFLALACRTEPNPTASCHALPRPIALAVSVPRHAGKASGKNSGNAYRRNGVCEYIVWRVLDREIDWFVLHDGRYEPLPLSSDGLLRSIVFPGLWLDPAALIRGDLAKVLAVVRQGVSSPEHADFAAGLRRP